MSNSSKFLASDGDGYELNMGRWSRRLARPFLDFAGTRDGEQFLDVGCGTGHLAAAVLERSPSAIVHGIDLAPVYVEYASFADYWAPYLGKDGPGAEYVATLTAEERNRLERSVRVAYLDGEPDGPRSYAALAWAAKGLAP